MHSVTGHALASIPHRGCCGVQGLGFRVQASGFRVQGSRFRVQGSGFRVQGSGFRVQGSGFKVQGVGFTAQSVPGANEAGFRGLGLPPDKKKLKGGVVRVQGGGLTPRPISSKWNPGRVEGLRKGFNH